MINLIPHNAKRTVKREYIARVVVAYLCLGSLGLIICSLLLVPSYLNVVIELQNLESQVAAISDEQAEAESLQTELRSAAVLLSGVESFETIDPLLPAIYDLQTIAGGDISLDQYAARRTAEGVLEDVVVRGVADSRTALASFEERLEMSTAFGEVVIPLANLARDQDIPFTLTIPIVSAI